MSRPGITLYYRTKTGQACTARRPYTSSGMTADAMAEALVWAFVRGYEVYAMSEPLTLDAATRVIALALDLAAKDADRYANHKRQRFYNVWEFGKRIRAIAQKGPK